MSEEMKSCPKCSSPYGYSLGNEIYACPECGNEWNPNEKPEDQVKNNFHFGKNNRAVIKTGANMSGKTKSLKQSIWPIAFANSI